MEKIAAAAAVAAPEVEDGSEVGCCGMEAASPRDPTPNTLDLFPSSDH